MGKVLKRENIFKSLMFIILALTFSSCATRQIELASQHYKWHPRYEIGDQIEVSNSQKLDKKMEVNFSGVALISKSGILEDHDRGKNIRTRDLSSLVIKSLSLDNMTIVESEKGLVISPTN